MVKYRIKKLAFRGPQANSTVAPGIYESKNFKAAELDFLKSINAVEEVETTKKKVTKTKQGEKLDDNFN